MDNGTASAVEAGGPQAQTRSIALHTFTPTPTFGVVEAARPTQQTPEGREDEDSVTDHAISTANSTSQRRTPNREQSSDLAPEIVISGSGLRANNNVHALLASKRHVLRRRKHPQRCSCPYHTTLWAETCTLYIHRPDRIQHGSCNCRFCEWVRVLGPWELYRESLFVWIKERGREEEMQRPVDIVEDLWMVCWEKFKEEVRERD